MTRDCFGYMGKVLWVDLSEGTTRFEEIDDAVYEEFLTGYGLGVKLIYENQKPGLSAFHSDNILGFMSGLLNGTGAHFAGRYTVMGKSPLTGTWGDANSGGNFAPMIKKTGVDGIFFTGKSPKPVYLLIENGEIQLKETIITDKNGKMQDIWGMDALSTEEALKNCHGKNHQVSCIGTAGEQQSLLAGIVTDAGRMAARSGLGALMGSKNLKALCLYGEEKIQVVNRKRLTMDNRKFVQKFTRFKSPVKEFFRLWASTTTTGSHRLFSKNEHQNIPRHPEFPRYIMGRWGTSGVVAFGALKNDTPIRNWTGNTQELFPVKKAAKISGYSVARHRDRNYGCHSCPLHCGGFLKRRVGEVKLGRRAHKPEYETIAGFGTFLESTQLENILAINDKLNKAGLDAIGVASTLGWIYELAEENILEASRIPYKIAWKDNSAALALVEDIIANKGMGSHLRNGIRAALPGLLEEGYIHKDNAQVAEAAGMQVYGQELPMHDPRNVDVIGINLGVAYEAEPTPGQHTTTRAGSDDYVSFIPMDIRKIVHVHPLRNRAMLPHKAFIGENLMRDSCFMDLINSLGVCAFGVGGDIIYPLVEYINNITGWQKRFPEYLKCGQRIKILRHCFNVREGINIREIRLPERIRSQMQDYNGHSFDQLKDLYFKNMGYDLKTLKPTEEIKEELGLTEILKNL